MKTKKTTPDTAPLSYEQAISRLDQIAHTMETGEIGIDQMAEKLQEAQALISYCRQKLFDAEKNCQDLLKSTSPEQ